MQIEISPRRVQQLDSGVKTFIQGKQARNKERLQAQVQKATSTTMTCQTSKKTSPNQLAYSSLSQQSYSIFIYLTMINLYKSQFSHINKYIQITTPQLTILTASHIDP